MENEQEFEEGRVLIEIVQKMQDGRVGIDVQFKTDEMDTGTFIDLGVYFTTLGRGQKVKTKMPDDAVPEANGQQRSKRPLKPKPVRE